ncbi:MAG: hypothetical protein DRP42_07105 [Tenericutes bacterium]|nr:MAG: hypothetical protein DRP42_07105 [Mycoplasmatota bacterium]
MLALSPNKALSETFINTILLTQLGKKKMKQFKATQNTPEYGPQSLHMRLVGKLIFIKGAQNSTKYVDKLIEDFERKGAVIVKGNGGWVRIDIIKDHAVVKLGDVELDVEESSDEVIEEVLFDFFFQKYTEAKFLVQEIVE